jgi:signal recognition particle receptor subunit beta
MPTYNYKSRELIAKIVYYGPGRCGKTTNLQQIHQRMRPETRSELLSVATETDRTIYFDLLPLNLGTISGMKFMVRLFTVPGQVYYGETRKLVLRGADGIVFVADSQDHMLDENRQSLRDLKDNLAANGLDYNTIPLVLQYNKRDLPRLIPEAELESTLNDRHVKSSTAIASEGNGVLETLRYVTLAVFNHIKAGGKVGPEQQRPGTGPIPGSPTGHMPMPQAPMGGPMAGVSPTLAGAPSMPPPSYSGQLTGQGGALQRALAVAAAAAAPLKAGPDGYGQMPTTDGPSRFGGAGTGPLPSYPPGGLAPPQSRPPSNPSGFKKPTNPGMQSGTLHPPGSSLPGMSSLMGQQPMRPSQSPLNPNGPQPVRISGDLVLDEFKHLAVMTSQMAERLVAIERELNRLGRENQEIRELLARQSQV